MRRATILLVLACSAAALALPAAGTLTGPAAGSVPSNLRALVSSLGARCRALNPAPAGSDGVSDCSESVFNQPPSLRRQVQALCLQMFLAAADAAFTEVNLEYWSHQHYSDVNCGWGPQAESLSSGVGVQVPDAGFRMQRHTCADKDYANTTGCRALADGISWAMTRPGYAAHTISTVDGSAAVIRTYPAHAPLARDAADRAALRALAAALRLH
jgi:hypothetical protein